MAITTRAQLAVERAAADNADEAAGALHDSQGRMAPYLSTAHSRVLALRALRLAPSDLFVDLGCGDGRLALTAVTEFGAATVGVDVSPSLISICRRAAKHAGIDCSPGARLRFLRADLSSLLLEATPAAKNAAEAEDDGVREALGRATAIYAYLHPLITPSLTPILLRAMSRGARVVTMDHHLPSAADAEVLQALPADCQPFAHYLNPTERHLFGKMRLYSDAGSLATAEALAHSTRNSIDGAEATRIAQSNGQRAALLAHTAHRHSSISHEPFECHACTLAATAVRQAIGATAADRMRSCRHARDHCLSFW